MTQPIKPSDLPKAKIQYIPPLVFEAFNELITKHWNGSSSKFLQDEVLSLIETKTLMMRNEIFKRKFLDVEEVYRAQGWTVIYDKPAYCESYSATFEFRQK